MKKSILLLWAVMLLLAFNMPVLAQEKGERALEITQTLVRYQVSANWPNDLNSNEELLSELYNVMKQFESSDVVALGKAKAKAIEYYTAYGSLQGLDSSLPLVFSQQEPEVPTLSSRESALEILSQLKRGKVDANVQGDIKANHTQIENMLMFAFGYTNEDYSATSASEQETMLKYFKGLYNYRGWDITELDLLFTVSVIPLGQSKSTLPYTPPSINVTQPENQPSNVLIYEEVPNDAVSVLGYIACFVLWISIMAILVFVLKRRAEKRSDIR